MSDIGYPLVKCYHPRHVQNKYTGEVIQVGCGVCKACLKRRADKMSFLCAIEEQSHKYCMFATLTYSMTIFLECILRLIMNFVWSVGIPIVTD